MTGTVYDSDGRERYILKGLWNESLIAKNLESGKETLVWKRHELPLEARMYFFFTEFAMNLNLLNSDLIK